MRSGSGLRASWLASVGALAGCAGAPAPPPHPADAAPASVELAAPPYVSPARFRYHPPAPDFARAWVRMPDGGCVLVAEGGQRWLVTPEPRRPEAPPPEGSPPRAPGGPAAPACAGRGRVSAVAAPEELLDVIRKAGAAWLFVGESGAVYEAATPLGPFGRTLAPAAAMRKVAGAGAALLAVTNGGGLLRWEDGWRPVALDGGAPEAPGQAAPHRIFDVAVAEGGRALALAVPEALFASDDGGVTWSRSPLPPMGLSRVGVAPGGGLMAQGLLESTSWDPRRTPAFSTSGAALPQGQPELAVNAGRAPAAAAVQYGRAAMSGDRYYEALRPDEPNKAWALASGSIEEPLEVRAMPGTVDCGSIKLGANGKILVAVCVRLSGDEIVADVLRSDDAGGAWSLAAKLETPDVDRVGVAVAPDGAALLTGLCRPGRGGASGQGAARPADACRPSAPLLLRMERDTATVTPVAAPTLGAPAALPAFSVDGRSAYFAGYRVKDDRLALFVSHDGGETFAPRPLERPAQPATASPPPDEGELDDEDEPDEPAGSGVPAGFDLTEDSALRPGEDGAVGLLLSADGAPVYVTTDDDGRLLGVAGPPGDAGVLAGFGRRVLALGQVPPRAEDDAGRGAQAGVGAVQLWESLDGGLSFVELPAMPALSRDFFRGSPVIACGAAACLLGDTVTRVGWGGQTEPPPPRAEEPPTRTEPAVGAQIVCGLTQSAGWTQVEHADGRAWGAPGANEAMRGRSVWSILTRDPAGAVAVTAAVLPVSGEGEARVVTRVLLPSPSRGARVATSVALQMEGYAAARLRLPGAAGAPLRVGAPMRNVALAWENWMDGTSGRGVLADAGPLELGDVKGVEAAAAASGPPAQEQLDPELLSVSLRGIFVRPHAGSARSALTFFFEPGGKLRRFDYPTWPAEGLGGRLDIASDAAIADGQPVGVGMVREQGGLITTVLLAHRAPQAAGVSAGQGGWSLRALTVTPPPARDLIAHTDWTYAGSAIGVTSLVADPERAAAWAMFQPFRADGTLGPARPLPTPFDLPAAPRPCSAAERAATARLEAPMFLRGEALFSGTRHPVLVQGAGALLGLPEPLTLLTAGAVLHGTPAAPCVAAWEAGAVGRAPVVAIVPGDLAHAWLFRLVPASSGSGAAALSFHPMACRFDPAAKVPDTVWSEPGTTRVVR